MKDFFRKNKKFISVFLVIFVGIFLVYHNVYAANWIEGAFLKAIGSVVYIIVKLLGVILSYLVDLINAIAKYNNFANEKDIIMGWRTVRDLCNMFFVLIFLVIAFATILRVESYQLKKTLPKLILMAVLINFSKTICALLIDFSQIIMLTFVNAFSGGTGGEFIGTMKIKEFVSATNSHLWDDGPKPESQDLNSINVMTAYLLAVLFMVIATIVLAAVFITFLMRMIMFWIYIVLSPLAFILSAFPSGAKYASQYWGEFTRYLINGPVLAFFVWLALVTAGNIDTGSFQTLLFGSIIPTQIGEPSQILGFVISIGFLVGGLVVSQQIGGIGSSWGAGMLKTTGSLSKKGAFKLAMGDNFLARKVARYSKIDFRPIKLVEGFKNAMESSKTKDESLITQQTKEHFEAGGLRSLLLGATTGEDYFNRYFEGFLGTKGLWRAGKELAYNPLQRKSLGQKIDGLVSEKKDLDKKKENILGTKKPLLDNYVEGAVSGNIDLIKMNSEAVSNNEKIKSLNDDKNNGNWSPAKERELNELEEKNKELTDKISVKDKDVREKAKEDFMNSSDGRELKEVELKIKANEDSLKRYKDDIYKVQKPVAFQARSAYRQAVDESKKKFSTITNADELLRAKTDAEQRGDKFDQIAIMEKLMNDANFNEELRAKGYSSDAKGLYKYVFNEKNVFGDKKGLGNLFTEGEKLQVLNDLGEAAERVGHWDMAKMVGMNSKGELESLVKEVKDSGGNTIGYDDTAHAMASYAEILKMDPQVIANKLNRLAYGGEDGNGKFQIATLGKMLFKYLAASGTYERSANRLVGNTAANLMEPQVVKEIHKLGIATNRLNSAIKVLRGRGLSASGESNLADSVVRALDELNAVNRD